MNDKGTILAVGDASKSLAMLDGILTRAGYQVRSIDSGELALAAVAANPPDLILLDVRMKGVGGLEVCRSLKARKETRRIPILLTGAFADVKEWVEGLQLGAADYIAEPFQVEELLTRVKTHMALRLANVLLEQQAAALRRTSEQLQSELVKRHRAENELRLGLDRAERSRRAMLSALEDQKRAGEERQRLQAQLIQSQKLEAIGTLAGGVAHEINNPIMGIMNYAQLILDKLGPASPVAGFVTEIGLETERVATIVKNLLAFSRHDEKSHSPARLCDIANGTLSLMQTVMRHDRIALEVDVPEDLPPVKCRSQQIQQVIMNLLTNARDALNAKYPQHAADKKILLTVRQMEKAGRRWIRTTVEDHGPGIPEELREHIFEPFFTTKPRDKGTGLGLSINHGIVKAHHGELSVESELGEWTRFHVDLPVDNGWELENRGTANESQRGMRKAEQVAICKR